MFVADAQVHIWGANTPERPWPDLSRLPCNYRQGITMFAEELPWLPAEDKTWIMGRGVCEWLGWALPESRTAKT